MVLWLLPTQQDSHEWWELGTGQKGSGFHALSDLPLLWSLLAQLFTHATFTGSTEDAEIAFYSSFSWVKALPLLRNFACPFHKSVSSLFKVCIERNKRQTLEFRIGRGIPGIGFWIPNLLITTAATRGLRHSRTTFYLHTPGENKTATGKGTIHVCLSEGPV